MYNQNFPNILVAGRIISTNDEDGWEVSRVIPVCALTGQATGVASSMCIDNACGVNEINIIRLQELLKNDGVKI